jgi:hypothetical protein
MYAPRGFDNEADLRLSLLLRPSRLNPSALCEGEAIRGSDDHMI